MQDIEWIKYLKNDLIVFLDTLKKNEYDYRPVNEGITNRGNKLSLGFKCYALKILYILDEWKNVDPDIQSKIIVDLESYQDNIKKLPTNSFVDIPFYKFSKSKTLKQYLKEFLNFFRIYKYNHYEKLLEYNLAESKQAISTIYQLGFENNLKFNDFPKNTNEIYKLLDKYDWSKPWNAGAQFANLSLLAQTQLKENDEVLEILYQYIGTKLDKSTGFYFYGKFPENNELINGAMKVISGLDWLGKPIHEPEKIIEYCLKIKPSNEGCSLVDYVYVLYKCSMQTEYKKEEVKKYLFNIIEEIKKHKFEGSGFSYYLNRSQVYYYGQVITKGKNTPDIHGTLLLTWALSMISEINEIEFLKFNILKP